MMADGAGGAGGAGAADWKAALPEELRGAAYLADVKDLPTLVRNYGEAQAYRGQSLRIPSADAAPEVRAEFQKKLREKIPDLVDRTDEEGLRAAFGVPKDAKEYSAPKDVELPAAALEQLRAEAAAEGLSKRQFEARAKRVAEAFGAQSRAAQEQQAALDKEWGAASVERRAAAAQAALKLGDAELAKAIIEKSAPPQLVKMLAGVSKALGEGREAADQGGNGGGGGKMTPSEAQERRDEIRANPAYWDRNHPQHASLVRREAELTEFAFPDLVAQRGKE
jgi:hypothetical protein